MNDVFIYLSGLEILTKNAQTCSLFVLLGFHLMQMRNGFSHEVGVMDLWLFNQITDSGIT
jgi:hypothetical protein